MMGNISAINLISYLNRWFSVFIEVELEVGGCYWIGFHVSPSTDRPSKFHPLGSISLVSVHALLKTFPGTIPP